jgi:hypothetical protein
MLISPSRNLVRNARYEAQIKYHQIPINMRQLQRCTQKHIPGAQRYKCAFVKKVVLGKNLDERAKYGAEHIDKSIEAFWEQIVFTDKAHIDPSSLTQGHILWEHRKRYNDKNIKQRPPKENIWFSHSRLGLIAYKSKETSLL